MRGGGVVTPGFMGGVSKRDLHYVEMEFVGDPEHLPPEGFRAPSGRNYKFNNEAHRELVHPMDTNYLRAIYPVEKVPWRGVT